jgi:hypothetical protein
MTLVIELSISSIVDEAVARPLLELLEQLPGFGPARYDLNERQSWRSWELESAVVDLLTQRTQMFRVEGDGGTAVIATGKHGETPTMIIEGESTSDVDDTLLDRLPIAESRRAD